MKTLIEIMIMVAGLFILGVVGGLERGLLGIGSSVLLIAFSAAVILILASFRKMIKTK